LAEGSLFHGSRASEEEWNSRMEVVAASFHEKTPWNQFSEVPHLEGTALNERCRGPEILKAGEKLNPSIVPSYYKKSI